MDIAKLRSIFSARIRKLREGKYNQGEFADSVGVSRGAMSYYEQEARTPDIGVLRAICEKYNVSADYLLGLMEDENHAVSDVCRETGLSPKSAKVLKAIKPKTDSKQNSEQDKTDNAPVPYDPDIDYLYQPVFKWLSKATDDERLRMLRKVGPITELLNIMLEDENGLQLLTLLSAIVFGVNAGDDRGDEIWVSINSNTGSEILLPISITDLSSSLWVNIQYFAHALRDKQNPPPQEDEGDIKDDGKVVDYSYLLKKGNESNSESNEPPNTANDNQQPSDEV